MTAQDESLTFRAAGVTILSVLFMALGAGAILFMLYSIVTNPALKEAIDIRAQLGDTLLTFLNAFGIVLPLIAIGLGIYFIRLGQQLSQRDYTAAMWAKQYLFWVAVAAGIIFVAVVIDSTTRTPVKPSREWFPTAVGIFAIGVAAAAAWYWLDLNLEKLFFGQETLSSRDARLAWNLLIPTIAVLIMIAARPLERTFIASLTDQRFAAGAGRVTNFTGLSNYGQLLGVRVDRVPCVKLESGACETREVTVESTRTEEITVDNAALREILANITSGQSVPGVANLLNAINQPEAVQNAIDDESVNIAELMVSFDGERPLGSTMLLGMLKVTNPDKTITRLVGVDGDTAEVEVTVTETKNETIYMSARDVAGESYRSQRYAPLSSFSLFGSRYVISARDTSFIKSIRNTLLFTFFSVTLELVLGMIVAMTVNSKFAGRGLMRAAMLVPWAIPTVVSARLWEVMLRDNQSGVINHLVVNSGLADRPIAWLANPDAQLWSLIFVDVWKTTPFFALLLLAGLQTIPSDIYEAADVDGASKVRQFFNITLPLLRPTIAVALVFRTLDAVRAFDVFDVLLGKQFQSMATYNSFVLIENQQFGYASAVGVTIFIIIFVFTVIYVRALGVEAE